MNGEAVMCNIRPPFFFFHKGVTLMIVNYTNDVFPSGQSAEFCLGEVTDDCSIYLYGKFEKLGKNHKFLEAVALFHECCHILLGHKESNIKTEDDTTKIEQDVWYITKQVLGIEKTKSAMKQFGFTTSEINNILR
jgi:hypothetical protein